jgi:hypothetical protein
MLIMAASMGGLKNAATINIGSSSGARGFAAAFPIGPTGSYTQLIGNPAWGAPIRRILCLPGSIDLQIWFTNSDRTQGFWTELRIWDDSNTMRRYFSKDATYSGAGTSSWSFGTGSNPVWNTAIGLDRRVEFY